MGMWIILTLILPHSQPTLNLILSPDPEQSGLLKGVGVGEKGGRNMWIKYTLSYYLTLILPLNLILTPDPDPEQSGLLKGGGWERGVEHVD